MLISKKYLSTTILNNNNNSITKCYENILSKQTNAYSIIFNNDTNNYQLVNYSNFTNYSGSINISISANIKHSKYIEEAKYLFNNTENKEKLITNLNGFINYYINLDYIDDYEELIIPTDEMTITFTSTSIQKMNEN